MNDYAIILLLINVNHKFKSMPRTDTNKQNYRKTIYKITRTRITYQHDTFSTSTDNVWTTDVLNLRDCTYDNSRQHQ